VFSKGKGGDLTVKMDQKEANKKRISVRFSKHQLNVIWNIQKQEQSGANHTVS
jgi:hypothetical protein